MAIANILSWSAFAPAASVQASLSLSGDVQANIGIEIPTATTNQEVLVALDVSALKLLVISSNVALTLKTNSSGSPTDTIAIKAGIPYVWHDNAYASNLVTADVSKIFITNTSGSTATFQLLALTDTP